ncbi:hypothetical protein Tco_0367728 [Tanacetum coccineum]
MHMLRGSVSENSKIIENRRDLPRDNPLVSVEVLRYGIKRSKYEKKGIVPTEMELELEQTQQDVPIKRTCKLSDYDVHILEDPTLILEILSRIFLLRLNLPDHRYYFITACSYLTDTSNALMKAQVYVSKLPQL